MGLDDDHSIVVWDWRKGEKMATTRGHKDKIFLLSWNPGSADQLVTVGIKHIKFWKQAGMYTVLGTCSHTFWAQNIQAISSVNAYITVCVCFISNTIFTEQDTN